MTGIVDPDIDAVKVMYGESYDAINFFAVPHIAWQGESLIGMADSRPGSFRAAGVAGKHHHLRSTICENLRDRFSDAHGRTRNHCDFARKFHAGFVS